MGEMAESRKQYNARRKAAGICISCGSPKERDQLSCCDSCINQVKEKRNSRKEAGLCMGCGGEKEREDVQRCNECNRKNNDRVLERRYGITRDEYEELKARQGHKCALCHTDLEGLGKSVHVDHDHATGEVRGILCIVCNVLLGGYEKILALNLAPVFDKYLGQAIAQGLT